MYFEIPHEFSITCSLKSEAAHFYVNGQYDRPQFEYTFMIRGDRNGTVIPWRNQPWGKMLVQCKSLTKSTSVTIDISRCKGEETHRSCDFHDVELAHDSIESSIDSNLLQAPPAEETSTGPAHQCQNEAGCPYWQNSAGPSFRQARRRS